MASRRPWLFPAWRARRAVLPRAVVALGLAACRPHASGAPARDAAPAARSDAAPAPRRVDVATTAHTDAGAPDAAHAGVDLLRATSSWIGVSSVVQNPVDRAESLVDGNLETTWSSRTGQLDPSIVFGVPDGVQVDGVLLTVGMTRTTDAGDLFTMNPRIRRVEVRRNGVVVADAPLDTGNRSLQFVPIHRAGGFYRVRVADVLMGSHADWREVSVSEFEVLGTAPPEAQVPDHRPTVRLHDYDDRLPVTAYAPSEVTSANPGCLAWDPRAQTVACIAGDWVRSVRQAESDDERAHLNDALADRRTLAAVFMTVGQPLERVALNTRADGTVAPDLDLLDDPISAPAVRALHRRFRRGGFVALASLEHPVGDNERFAWGAARLRAVFTPPHDCAEGQSCPELHAVTMDWSASGATPPDAGDPRAIDDTIPSQAGSYALSVYLIPGGEYLVVVRTASIDEEWNTGQVSRAWLCRQSTRTCVASDDAAADGGTR